MHHHAHHAEAGATRPTSNYIYRLYRRDGHSSRDINNVHTNRIDRVNLSTCPAQNCWETIHTFTCQFPCFPSGAGTGCKREITVTDLTAKTTFLWSSWVSARGIHQRIIILYSKNGWSDGEQESRRNQPPVIKPTHVSIVGRSNKALARKWRQSRG